MANSAADARQSEMEIRKKLLQAHAVDVIIAIGPNFFYTVPLPCTQWFLDKGKAHLPASKSRSPRPASAASRKDAMSAKRAGSPHNTGFVSPTPGVRNDYQPKFQSYHFRRYFAHGH